MTCSSNIFTAKKGDLVFVNNNEIHSFDNFGNAEYIVLMIDPKAFENIYDSTIFAKNLIPCDNYVKRTFNIINKEITTQTKSHKLVIIGRVYELIAYIIRNYSQPKPLPNQIIKNNLITNRITEILSYISTNYDDKLTTSELAKNWYLNESYFCKTFKQVTGQSPINYINRLRIEKSLSLLNNTHESISKIAVTVGFDDVNYFSRTFKKYIGVNPSQYRNLKR